MPLDTALHKKAYGGEVDSCEDLIKEGEDVNVRGAQNRTALHRAAGANHVDVCVMLLKYGADPSLCDDSGRTALHWAALGGAHEVADLMQVDVNAKSKSGSTALHLAAESGKLEFVQWMLSHGADPTIKDTSPPDGKTAFQLAKDKNLDKIMSVLKAAGGDTGGGSSSSGGGGGGDGGGGCCVVM